MRARLTGAALLCASLYAIFNAGLVPLMPGEVRENRRALRALSQCYADYHGVSLRGVNFKEPEYRVPCERYDGWAGLGCMPGETIQVIGWARPLGHSVNYWDVSVRGDFEAARTLSSVAAHEVCHVTGIWDETATDICARRTIQQTTCSEGKGGDRTPRERGRAE